MFFGKGEKKYPIDYGMEAAYKMYKKTAEDPVSPTVFGRIVKRYHEEISSRWSSRP